jgi:hypothetical protein
MEAPSASKTLASVYQTTWYRAIENEMLIPFTIGTYNLTSGLKTS